MTSMVLTWSSVTCIIRSAYSIVKNYGSGEASTRLKFLVVREMSDVSCAWDLGLRSGGIFEPYYTTLSMLQREAVVDWNLKWPEGEGFGTGLANGVVAR